MRQNRMGRIVMGTVGIVLGATGVASADYQSTILADNPTGYWRFEESDGSVAGNSAAGHAGDVGNYVTPGETTFLGQPGAFTGSGLSTRFTPPGAASATDPTSAAISQVYSPTQPYAYANNYSIEAWVKLEPFEEDTARRIFGANYGFGVENGRMVFTTFGRKDYFAPVGNDVTPDAWHYLAVAFDGDDATFYLDGVNIGTANAEGAAADTATTATQFGIGRRLGGQQPWRGYIDELAVYDRLLTDADVAEHYAAAVPEPTGLGALVLGGLCLGRVARRRRRA